MRPHNVFATIFAFGSGGIYEDASNRLLLLLDRLRHMTGGAA